MTDESCFGGTCMSTRGSGSSAGLPPQRKRERRPSNVGAARFIELTRPRLRTELNLQGPKLEHAALPRLACSSGCSGSSGRANGSDAGHIRADRGARLGPGSWSVVSSSRPSSMALVWDPGHPVTSWSHSAGHDAGSLTLRACGAGMRGRITSTGGRGPARSVTAAWSQTHPLTNAVCVPRGRAYRSLRIKNTVCHARRQPLYPD